MSLEVRTTPTHGEFIKAEQNLFLKLDEIEYEQFHLALTEHTFYLERDKERCVKRNFTEIIPKVEKKIEAFSEFREAVGTEKTIDVWIDADDKYQLYEALMMRGWELKNQAIGEVGDKQEKKQIELEIFLDLKNKIEHLILE